MLNPLIIWIAKALAAWGIGLLEKHVGETAAAQHIGTLLANPKAVCDPNPPPSAEHNPNERKLLDG